MSHLLQMRGLKQSGVKIPIPPESVASFTDAWIETQLLSYNNSSFVSHLLQMRGLKHPIVDVMALLTSRIFYRCVD